MLSSGIATASAASAEPHHGGTLVEEWAIERLRTSAYSALKQLSCQYQGGALVLHGKLASYYLKQLAQVIVAQVAGMARIENHIEVPPACASSVCLSIGAVEPEAGMVDGSRKRRRNGEARRAWYAKWRSIRFARHLNNC
jgi:hypothetical protein